MAEDSRSPTTYMQPKTRDKFQKLAELDRRTLVDEYDVLADELLRARGIDPESISNEQPEPATAGK